MSDFTKDQAKEKFVPKAGTGSVFPARFDLSAKQKEIGLWGRGSFLTKSGEPISISILKKQDKNGREYLVILENEPQETDTEKALRARIDELSGKLASKEDESSASNDDINDVVNSME